MDLSKFTLAVFDIFAYLLPGLVLLVLASVIEATFFSSQVLALGRLGQLPVPGLIAAYFLGHLGHGLGTVLTKRIRGLDAPRGGDLPRAVFDQIRARVVQTFEIDLEALPDRKLDALSTYKFADSFVVAKDKAAERESLLLREAFALSSMGAFAAWGLVGIAALLFQEGLAYQLTARTTLERGPTLALAVLAFLIAAAFWRRYVHFALIRRSSIYTLFMALTAKTG